MKREPSGWSRLRSPTLLLLSFYGISTIVGYLMPNLFLYIHTVLFQTIQFNTNTLFRSIWPMDRTPSGATNLGQSGPKSNGNEGARLEPHHQNVLCNIKDTCWVGVLLLCIESVGVFCSPSCPSHKINDFYKQNI